MARTKICIETGSEDTQVPGLSGCFGTVLTFSNEAQAFRVELESGREVWLDLQTSGGNSWHEKMLDMNNMECLSGKRIKINYAHSYIAIVEAELVPELVEGEKE